jgi:hypothetical protein
LNYEREAGLVKNACHCNRSAAIAPVQPHLLGRLLRSQRQTLLQAFNKQKGRPKTGAAFLTFFLQKVPRD